MAFLFLLNFFICFCFFIEMRMQRLDSIGTKTHSNDGSSYAEQKKVGAENEIE